MNNLVQSLSFGSRGENPAAVILLVFLTVQDTALRLRESAMLAVLTIHAESLVLPGVFLLRTGDLPRRDISTRSPHWEGFVPLELLALQHRSIRIPGVGAGRSVLAGGAETPIFLLLRSDLTSSLVLVISSIAIVNTFSFLISSVLRVIPTSTIIATCVPMFAIRTGQLLQAPIRH